VLCQAKSQFLILHELIVHLKICGSKQTYSSSIMASTSLTEYSANIGSS
jgi:hypothetical protein